MELFIYASWGSKAFLNLKANIFLDFGKFCDYHFKYCFSSIFSLFKTLDTSYTCMESSHTSFYALFSTSHTLNYSFYKIFFIVYLKYVSLLCNAHFFENNFQFIEIKSLSKDRMFNSEVQYVQVKLLG